MNRILFLSALFFGANTVFAQNPAPAPDAEFKNFINQARSFDTKNPGAAQGYYKKALEKAQSDEQKAEAQLGLGNSTPLRAKSDDPKNENAARLSAFQAVLDLTGATTVQKNAARLGLALTQFQTEQYETALSNYQSLVDSAEATPAQKNTAQIGGGETLLALKRFDDARTRLEAFLKANTGSPAQNTVAHRLIALSYLGQNNGTAAQVVMKKLAAVPSLKDEQIAVIYRTTGDFFREQKQPALSRAAYEMIPPLADASIKANIEALMKIGLTYFDEKNFGKAREIWAAVLDMRGGQESTADVWQFTGVAYAHEKNYVAAREAGGKWRDATTNIPTKVSAWETIASTFLEEKNYAGARDALANIGKLGITLPNPHDKAQLNLRQKVGVVQVFRQEGDFVQAAATLKEILAAVPIGAGDPSYYYEARKQYKAVADEMAKDKASMDAALGLYEAWEKFYPYEFNKGEANMAMGDILAAQGKKDEAKAKYQRVIELRKNYDDAKIAQSKMDKLDGKAGA